MSDVSSFEEVLEKDGKLIYTSKGNSMYPLIRKHDVLVIERVQEPLKKCDIPLYKRYEGDGHYVLHRIISVRNDSYITCGDNRYHWEKIKKTDVIGVLRKIIRQGKEVEVHDPGYDLFYCHLYPIRFLYLFIRQKLKK